VRSCLQERRKKGRRRREGRGRRKGRGGGLQKCMYVPEKLSGYLQNRSLHPAV
jgi:hypothetical protein